MDPRPWPGAGLPKGTAHHLAELGLVPGFEALASGVLAWFVMQARMEVKLAQQRDDFAEESTGREAFDSFLSEPSVEQRHDTRENCPLLQDRRSLVQQQPMCFHNIPLSDWIEHEIALEQGADPQRVVQDMTVFDKAESALRRRRAGERRWRKLPAQGVHE